MYTPPQFEESRLPVMHALMRAHPFSTVVAATSAGIAAEHLPLLLLSSTSPLGVLQGHVARANPVWQTLGDDSDVLAIFQGANRYISPKWYPSKQEHGKVVPTWNYLVVHARGKVRWNHDRAWLRRHVEDSTESHEGQDNPWRVADAPAEYIDRMLEAIVGLEVRLLDIKGKWKLSQNRSERDRAGVMRGLREQRDASAAEMLDWMRGSESDS